MPHSARLIVYAKCPILKSESKKEISVAKAQNYIGTLYRKNVNREGGQRTYFLNRGTKGRTPYIKIWSHVHTRVGTQHKISNISCW